MNRDIEQINPPTPQEQSYLHSPKMQDPFEDDFNFKIEQGQKNPLIRQSLKQMTFKSKL